MPFNFEKLSVNLVLLLFCILGINGAPFPNDDSAVKIIGGIPASPGEFPFVVSLQVKNRVGGANRHSCGATLITPSKLITAAKCVQTGITINYVVVAGAYTLKDAIDGHQEARDIRKITLHPNYEYSATHDDIAVIELMTPFSDSSTIKTIPLARRSAEYTGTCVIAGWGAFNSSNTSALAETIMKGDVQVHPKPYCKAAYQEYVEDKQICANGRNGDTIVEGCLGDNGGPLICTDPENGQKYLAGVSAYRYMCGNAEKPGVYMEISKYRSWLDAELFSGGDQSSTTTVKPTTTTKATTTAPTTKASTKKPLNDDIINRNNGSAAANESQPNQYKPVYTKCGNRKRKNLINNI